MKKVLVIIMSYLVSGLLCFNLSAEDDLADKIHIHRTNPTTRSLIDLPEAIICRELLTVSHNASGVYSLQIENSFGFSVYTSSLPADGMEYSYDLSGIGEGMFRLVLEGPGGEYEGYFNLYGNQEVIGEVGGIIGYREEVRTVKINDDHDGLIGTASALWETPAAGVKTHIVQGVNHLEMGTHDLMLQYILNAIAGIDESGLLPGVGVVPAN